MKEWMDGLALTRCCSADAKILLARKRSASALFEDNAEGIEGEESLEIGARADLRSEMLSFKPLYLISNWMERSTLNNDTNYHFAVRRRFQGFFYIGLWAGEECYS